MPKMTSTQKQAAKEAKAASEAETKVVEAILIFPADAEKLKEEFIDRPLQYDADLKGARQGPAAVIAHHNMRLKKIYQADPKVAGFIKWLAALSSEKRSVALRQTKYLLERLPLDDMPELPLYEPGTIAPDEGSLFDESGAGERHTAERQDDPGRAQKRGRRDPAPAPQPAAGMPLDEAEEAFQRAAAKASLLASELDDDDLGPAQVMAEAAKAGDDHIREQVAARGGEDALKADDDIPPILDRRKKAPKADKAHGSYTIN